MSLKDFTTLSEAEADMVLKWRNSPKVAEFMRTKTISPEAHAAFLRELVGDPSRLYFLVYRDSEPIGVIDFVGISDGRAEFGLYQSPALRGFGECLMREIFAKASELHLHTLDAYVAPQNERALALYWRFGMVQIAPKGTFSGQLLHLRINLTPGG